MMVNGQVRRMKTARRIIWLAAAGLGLACGCSHGSGSADARTQSRDHVSVVPAVPDVDDTITSQSALALAKHYGLTAVAGRIRSDPDRYGEWVFDGCSMAPDALLSQLLKVPELTEICLRHDLAYGYGLPGNKEERLQVDSRFREELLHAGAPGFAAKAMFDAVRIFGKEEGCLSFTWGFALKSPCRPGAGFDTHGAQTTTTEPDNHTRGRK